MEGGQAPAIAAANIHGPNGAEVNSHGLQPLALFHYPESPDSCLRVEFSILFISGGNQNPTAIQPGPFSRAEQLPTFGWSRNNQFRLCSGTDRPTPPSE